VGGQHLAGGIQHFEFAHLPRDLFEYRLRRGGERPLARQTARPPPRRKQRRVSEAAATPVLILEMGESRKIAAHPPADKRYR
jgi:hypothetical protein